MDLAGLKADAHTERRSAERSGIHKVLQGDHDVVFPTRNIDAGNPWDHD